MSVDVKPRPQSRTPLWRNVTVLKWTAQVAFLVGIIALGIFVWSRASTNLDARGIRVSFDFLSNPPGIAIAEGIDTRPATGARAFYVGIINMLRVTVAGIAAATVLGVLLGIARLSHNWIVNKVATVYIETIRNIPLLVQIVFWGAVVTTALGNLTFESGPLGCAEPVDGCEGFLFMSNKGTSFAWLFPADGFWQWSTVLLLGIGAAVVVYRRRFHLKEEQGAETYPLSWAFGTFLVFAVVGWWAHPVMGILGVLWGWLSSLFSDLPTSVLQVVLGALAVLAAGWWIKRFLDSRRTPAGLAKLTDDDYFRLGSAALLGLVGAVGALLVPGISRWILSALSDLFDVMDRKFDFLDAGAPLSFSRPSIVQPGNFANFGTTGLTMSKLFFPVFVGVTLYTAAFIAEIVRGGILAISKGQTEAGLAVGLRRSQLLRLIILPQAFRIILPPMGNQYLNLAKNTSLGIAVAYPEVVAVGQTLYNQTGATIPVVVLWMLFYVSVSLTISAIVNWYNRRVQLVER